MKIKYYVINLDRSPERLNNISAQCKKYNIDFVRISAFDGNILDLEKLADDTACRYEMGRSIQPGEVGCFLSHKKALDAFLSSKDEFAVILEDDAILSKNFSKSINDICSFIIQNQQLNVLAVNLGASDYKYSTPIKEYDHITLLRAHRFPMLATGILWTRHGAAIISKDKNRVRYPYDNYLRMLLTRGHMGLSVKHSLITSTEGKSDINLRSNTLGRSKQNRNIFYLIIKQKRVLRDKILAIYSILKWNFKKPKYK
jgi:glycosyl transferase family 25